MTQTQIGAWYSNPTFNMREEIIIGDDMQEAFEAFFGTLEDGPSLESPFEMEMQRGIDTEVERYRYEAAQELQWKIFTEVAGTRYYSDKSLKTALTEYALN